jgi:hypothetical protein
MSTFYDVTGLTYDEGQEHILALRQQRDTLLAALEAMTLTEMYWPDHPARQNAYKQARAAIAQAKGE